MIAAAFQVGICGQAPSDYPEFTRFPALAFVPRYQCLIVACLPGCSFCGCF